MVERVNKYTMKLGLLSVTDFASIYETNVFTIKQDHLSTNSIHASTCRWRRKQVESEGGGGCYQKS